jgi:hypothetical protein
MWWLVASESVLTCASQKRAIQRWRAGAQAHAARGAHEEDEG